MIFTVKAVDKGRIITGIEEEDTEELALIEVETDLAGKPGVWLLELKEVRNPVVVKRKLNGA